MSQIVGTDDRSMPVEFSELIRASESGSIDFRVVLVRGEANDIAAYRGGGSAEWVKEHGDKISQAEALGHFPGLETYLKREELTWRQ